MGIVAQSLSAFPMMINAVFVSLPSAIQSIIQMLNSKANFNV